MYRNTALIKNVQRSVNKKLNQWILPFLLMTHNFHVINPPLKYCQQTLYDCGLNALETEPPTESNGTHTYILTYKHTQTR